MLAAASRILRDTVLFETGTLYIYFAVFYRT
jgi:hypothetical protein